MFGPRLTRIFASRWAALWWAAGIILLAWQVAGSGEDTPGLDSAAAQPTPTASADNPWAIGSR